MTPPAAPAGLARAIGVTGLAATVINTIIGSSIFVFPAIVAQALGPAGIAAYLLAAGAMGLIQLCFAESGSRVSAAGGPYAYVETAFGPLAAWIVGSLLYVGVQLIASAVVATVFQVSLASIFPALGGRLARAVFLIAVFALFATVNIRGGARIGARVVEGITLAKLAPLVLLIVVGLVAFRPEYVRWASFPPLEDVARMTMRLMYLYAGMEAALAVSGELRDPARTAPRGGLLGLAIATAIYVGVQFAAQGLLGPELPAHTQTPLADAARVVLGTPGRVIILVGAVISTLGYLSADMLASPRSLFAMAGAGRLPRVVATVHPRYGSPAIAIATHATLACLLALIADFDTLTSLSASALLAIYVICCAATLRLRHLRVGEAHAPFRLPLGPTIPILAIAVVGFLMTTLAAREVLALSIFLVVAVGAFLVSRRGRPVASAELD